MKLESVSGTLAFLVIALNGLWYYIKYVLHQHGYETHLFWGHFKDISNLQRLHAQEQDLGKKRNFKMLLFALYIGLGLFLIAAVMMFSSI